MQKHFRELCQIFVDVWKTVKIPDKMDLLVNKINTHLSTEDI